MASEANAPSARVDSQPTVLCTYNQFGLASMNVSGATDFFYDYNQHGDTLRLVDATGVAMVSYVYTSWGEIASSGDATLIATNQFTRNGRDGVPCDAATGMYWMGARNYDSIQARFTQVDPHPTQAGSPDAAYLYAGNNPVNFVDPDGLAWYKPWTWSARDAVAVVGTCGATAGGFVSGVASGGAGGIGAYAAVPTCGYALGSAG